MNKENKDQWLREAAALLDSANLPHNDQGVWVNLHMLHGQGKTPTEGFCFKVVDNCSEAA
jgi:hypothetical protein